jgi:hypothetical protein
MRVVEIFIRLAVKRERQQLFDLTVAVRHTQGMDAKVFQQFLNDLQGDE